MAKYKTHLVKDAVIILVSVIIAVYFARSDVLVRILTSSQQWELLGSFVAGMFFTTIFTTALAIVTLGEIAQVYPVISVAFFGAIGAVIGDLIIFRFVKDRLSQDLLHLIKNTAGGERLKTLVKLKYFRWLTFLIGGLIIASPLPDELGITFFGFSKIKTSLFIFLSFTFNFIGIYIIGTVARSLI